MKPIKAIVPLALVMALALIAYPLYARCGRCARDARKIVAQFDENTMTLAKAITAAETHSGGRAVSVISELDAADGELLMEVYCISADKLTDKLQVCHVDGSTGSVIAMIETREFPITEQLQDTGRLPAGVAGNQSSELQDFTTYPPDEIKWKPGPPSLPPGAQMAVLEGDPSKEGPFVFRLRVPDGYTIAPHTHPRAERVTVIQGTFNIAEGDKVDKSSPTAKTMRVGSFGYWPTRMDHFAWAGSGSGGGGGGGETIIQLHGFGPWQINYLNPADDPRNQKAR